jgi:hypothetical protein
MKKIIILLAAIVAMVSCQKVMTNQTLNDGQMRFDMSLGTLTKASANEFETGDKVGLFVVEYDGEAPAPLQISGNWANNVATVFNGTLWTPVKAIYWPKSENKVDVYGYYPYMDLSSVDEQSFTVALDQNTVREGDVLGGYEASDLIWAKTVGASPTDEPVELQFKHIMSRLEVRLVKGDKYVGELPDVSDLYIHNVVPTAIVNLTTGSVSKDMYADEATIKAKRIDNATFEAIIVPQRLASSLPLIEIVSNGVSYLLESSFYFRNYKQHILELTINGNPDQIRVEIGGEVQDWTE